MEADCDHHWNHLPVFFLLPTLILSLVCLFNTSLTPSDSYSVCRLPFEHIHDFPLFSFDPFKHSPSSKFIYMLAI